MSQHKTSYRTYTHTPVGMSLQRAGVGIKANDFRWTSAAASPGVINPSQVIFRAIRLPWIIFFDFDS
jgi:hypothetical protein